MPRDPVSERKKRIELVKTIVRQAGKIHVHKVYSALLSTYGVSRKTIDNYIDECIYMGLMIRNDNHLVWIEKKAGEK